MKIINKKIYLEYKILKEGIEKIDELTQEEINVIHELIDYYFEIDDAEECIVAENEYTKDLLEYVKSK